MSDFNLTRLPDVLLPDEVRELRARAERAEARAEEMAGALRNVAVYGEICWCGVYCGGTSLRCAAILSLLAQHQGERHG